MPNIRALREASFRNSNPTSSKVLMWCCGRARQMSLGPAPSILASASLESWWLLLEPTHVPENRINPLTLVPGRSGSALPSSVPVQRQTPRSEPVPLRHQTSSLPRYPPLVTTSLPFPPPPLLLFASSTTARLHLYVASCPRKGAWRFGPSFQSRCFVRSLHV
jgi:hypothetical protein